jgi:hypothetical protein
MTGMISFAFTGRAKVKIQTFQALVAESLNCLTANVTSHSSVFHCVHENRFTRSSSIVIHVPVPFPIAICAKIPLTFDSWGWLALITIVSKMSKIHFKLVLRHEKVLLQFSSKNKNPEQVKLGQ